MQSHDKADTVETSRPEHGTPTDTVPGDLFAPPLDPDPSDLGDLDPLLADLMETVTERLEAGETIDVEELVSAHPERAEDIRRLIRAVQGLAVIGKTLESDGMTSLSADPDGKVQRVFGDFRIIGEVGRGGMGIVYEARQITIPRRVALKVLPLAAAADPRAIQRFQLEAQVAGLLEHAHIVPVYSVGIVADVPYYAMQFIEGGSLADLIGELRGLVDRGALPAEDRSASGSGLSALALDLLAGRFAVRPPETDDKSRPSAENPGSSLSAENHTSIRSRAYLQSVVRLGIQAADALAHAHDQGIIHRDIKPANLLLDRRCHLWVADFGMADVQGDAGLTMTGDLPGTLRYMSPEQATGKRALVDRRTDIYAVGATLYELLTLHTAVRGVDRQEILRRIIEEEPEPIRRFNVAVPVDLATIVTKALSKEPANRYETARRMAEDLGRFLEGRPITARPLGPIARTWRWCKRKPLQATLAASLVLGVTGITWNWREAVRQKGLLVVSERNAQSNAAKAQAAENEARKQAAKADAINTFLIDKLLGQASPNNNPKANRVTLREALDRAAAEVGPSFAGQPEIEAAIRLAIGLTYHDLGDYSKSETHYRAAYEIYCRISDETGEGRLKAMAELGHELVHLGRMKEAEPLLVSAVEETGRALGPTHNLCLNAIDYLASFKQQNGHDNDAEALYRRLVDDSRRARGPKHPDTLTAINNLGGVLRRGDKLGEAERLFRECLQLQKEVHGPEHPHTLTALANLAGAMYALGRLDEAEALFRQSLEAERRVLGPEHPETLFSLGNLATVLHLQGRLAEAESLFRTCLDARKRTLGIAHRDTLKTAERLNAVLKLRSATTNSEPKAVPLGAKN
jgi:eukaryotic-like serine/threonine-protein kinase